MCFEDFSKWSEETWNESYFNPWSPGFSHTWDTFNRDIESFDDQLLIIAASVLAAIGTFFIGGLGGVATFRLMTEKYSFKPINTQNKEGESSNNPASDAEGLARRVEEVAAGLTSPIRASDASHRDNISDAAVSSENRIGLLKVLFPRANQESESLHELLAKCVAQFPEGDLGRLIHKFTKISEDQREDVLKYALKLGVDFQSLLEFSNLIGLIPKKLNLPKSGRGEQEKFSSIVGRASAWVSGMKKANPIGDVLALLAPISIDEQELFVACAKELVGQLKEEDRVYVMEMLKGLRERGCDIIALAKATSPLLKELKNVFLIPDILTQMQKVPHEEVEEVVALVQPLIKKLGDAHVISKVLQAVVDFPPEAERNRMGNKKVREERKVLLEGISDYLGGLSNGNQILRILKQIAELSPEERFITVTATLSHIKEKIKPEDREHVIKILKDFGRDVKEINVEEIEEKLELMKQIPNLLRKIGSEAERKAFLDLINKIPVSERGNVLAILKDQLNTMKSGQAMGQLIYAFFLIPPQARAEAFGLTARYLNKEDVQWPRIIAAMCSERHNPNSVAFRAEMITYLTGMLESITDQDALIQLAVSIWEHRDKFRLLDEQELAQVAFRIKLQFETTDKADPYNPPNLYSKLVKYSRIKTPKVDIPVCSVAGIKVSLNQKIFEERIKKAKKVTFADLPKGIGGGTIKGFFEAFETRLNALPLDKKREVEAYLKSQGTGGHSWELQRHHLDNDEINHWASACGSPGEAVPTVVEQVFSIINYIRNAEEKDVLVEYKDADGKVAYKKSEAVIEYVEGRGKPAQRKIESPLTPQEEALFGIARTVENCIVGKRHGVGMAYFSLPAKYKQTDIAPEDTDPLIIPVVNYLSPIIQEHISELLTINNNLMKAMTGTPGNGPVRDVHETRYVKNLIAKRVGLNEDIGWDRYDAGDNPLHNLTLEQALTYYFKHATPEDFVKKVRSCIKRDVKNTENLDRTFINLLDPPSDMDINKRAGRKLWDYAVALDEDGDYKLDEDDNPILTGDQGPTLEGAVELLIDAGYFVRD